LPHAFKPGQKVRITRNTRSGQIVNLDGKYRGETVGQKGAWLQIELADGSTTSARPVQVSAA
jgi:hypothetical protein